MNIYKWSRATFLLVLLLICSPPVFSSQESGQLELPMLINGGVDGSWVNPNANSQGFVIETVPALNLLIAYWYTFPETGDGREWFLSLGDINGDQANLKIYRVEGGKFNTTDVTEEVEVGTASITFTNCTTGQFTFTLLSDGEQQQFPINRITPDVDCETSLPQTQITFVSDSNSWVYAGGTWVFDVCIQLGPSESHGREEFRFDDAALSFDIDRYNTPDCTGPVQVQTLSFELVRIDKTMATLGSETVIANRVLLTDIDSGQEVKQILYFDNSQGVPVMTHGLLDGPLDADGFPSTFPEIFAEKQ